MLLYCFASGRADPTGVENQVILIGGNQPNQGQPFIYKDGAWKALCGESFYTKETGKSVTFIPGTSNSICQTYGQRDIIKKSLEGQQGPSFQQCPISINGMLNCSF